MYRFLFRASFFVLPLVAAAWAGCSDPAPDPVPDGDAGPPDTGAPEADPIDAGRDTGAPKRDCAADEEVDGLFKHLDCTGLYADYASKTVAAENKPYKPGYEFWSDGAEKSRFLFLPAGTTIDIANFDEWKFPNGTKLWKEFKVDGKRVETRLYWKTKGAWRHTTYRWNADETDAVRLDTGEKVTRAGKPPYEIPSSSQCDQCHFGHDEPVLGVEAVSLGVAGATGVTLATLAAESRLAPAPPATSLTIPDDATGKARPALGWLHANCGHCHNANFSAAAQFTQLFFLIKGTQLLPDASAPTVEDLHAYTTAVNVDSNKQDDDAGAPYVRIVPGDPTASFVSIVSGRRVPAGMDPNTTQMPPIVTRVVDTAGHQQLDDWISVIP
ncbi:MAG: hypothetical protein KF819_15285 [Labilithrix sp.]|nr:hypothetical protein [Labilithrix sp.]